jgi:hypothetical protein
MRILAFLLLIGVTLGQDPSPKAGPAKPKTAHSSAAATCRAELADLDDQGFEDFQQMPTPRLKEIRETLETCLEDSYDTMTRYQLASAGIMLEWTQRTVYQRYIDEEWDRQRASNTVRRSTSQSPSTTAATAKAPHEGP